VAGLDQLRARLRLGPALSDENPQIEPLTPPDVRALRLPWLSRFSPLSLAALLESGGTGLWVPNTGEYALAEAWRRRGDIANIVEVTARKGKRALVTALMDRLKSEGYRLTLLSDDAWRDQSRLYMELGFDSLETIVFFEKQFSRGAAAQTDAERLLPPLEYVRFDPRALDHLIALDANSFPWLWWNSREEFENYIGLPGVFVYLARLHGEPIGYSSFTMYSGWSHLDRLAVVASHQGKGYGAAQLHFVLGRMAEMGAASVALSTQQDNTQSHRLYKGFGFKQSPDVMHFYGARLDPTLLL
jgi:GNAT superfamily N-acetyltransferase